MISGFRLIIEKYGCHPLKNLGMEESLWHPHLKWRNPSEYWVVLAALARHYVAIHSLHLCAFCKCDFRFFMEIHEDQLLGFACVP